MSASQRPETLKAGSTLDERHIERIHKAMRNRLSGASRGAGFVCDGNLCLCTGDDDCNDMFGSGFCGDGICFETGDGSVVCLCLDVE